MSSEGPKLSSPGNWFNIPETVRVQTWSDHEHASLRTARHYCKVGHILWSKCCSPIVPVLKRGNPNFPQWGNPIFLWPVRQTWANLRSLVRGSHEELTKGRGFESKAIGHQPLFFFFAGGGGGFPDFWMNQRGYVNCPPQKKNKIKKVKRNNKMVASVLLSLQTSPKKVIIVFC